MLVMKSQTLKSKIFFLFSLFFSLLVFKLTTGYMALATMTYCFLIYGIFFVADRKTHRLVMMTSITMDILLVLFLELSRQAIKTTVSNELNIFQLGHVLSSTIAIVFYLITAYYGHKAFNGQAVGKIHIKLGWLAFIFRSVGFVLMFSLIEKVTVS